MDAKFTFGTNALRGVVDYYTIGLAEAQAYEKVLEKEVADGKERELALQEQVKELTAKLEQVTAIRVNGVGNSKTDDSAAVVEAVEQALAAEPHAGT